ncbi:glycosyltransferase [Leifsonia sp. 2MCAF36]|uniref:glycosyltransferase n=1 Tax=Leifsonia sp. 2MCAF36 TaxID=3232988 RepID=UPI003F9969B2
MVRHGATLSSGAVGELRSVVDRFGDVDLIYTDGPGVLRPELSPLRLREQDYLGDVVVFRTAAARAALAQLGDAEPAADRLVWALVLEVIAAGGSAIRIPRPLTASESPGTPMTPRTPMTEADAELVRLHLGRLGVDATVTPTPRGVLDVRYALSGRPLVSIVIPTRGGAGTVHGEQRAFVVEAVRSIVERSTYQEIEIVVVADEATPRTVRDQLEAIAGDRLTMVEWTAPFNFAAKMNRGALHARGEYLLLLNDDVEVLSPDWVERMLGLAQQPGVGMVGALLLFEDGSVQHAGHAYRRGEPTHLAIGWAQDARDTLDSLGVVRETSGVTAACALMDADVFRTVGGFSTLLPSSYNDVDLCLKVRSSGRSVLWTPHARLHHYESRTRVAQVVPYERDLLLRRWGSRIQVDPYSREV